MEKEGRGSTTGRVAFLLLVFLGISSAALSPSGVNVEVVALIAVRAALQDPYNVMASWDVDSVDPCTWRMVTCSSDAYVSLLVLPSQNLSGTLSPLIGNLSHLQSILLQNNAILGPIPASIGMLKKLQTLDLSNNMFSGEIPSSFGDLKDLNYLRLNNNSLDGTCPESLSNIDGLIIVDLSFNNFSGSLPNIKSRDLKVTGNPLLCASRANNSCSISGCSTLLPTNNIKVVGGTHHHHMMTVLGATFGAVALSILVIIGLLFWCRLGNNQHIFFDIDEHNSSCMCLDNLRRYKFKELRSATGYFSSKNILGKGGYGIVYKGCLNDGTVVAIKRLKEYIADGGDVQFQTEVKTISLAVHRNLLRLCGFCMTENERLLVYPYMPNGSVASRLREKIEGQTVLDWARRKRIALGTARGLVYLHEQCEPKIIHRDVKAANILLDDDFEAVVGDFGLAKLLDHEDTHVTTLVRGTVGHIAPEYLSTGQSSEKTDVFGFGILLLELITGHKALDFARTETQKDTAMLDLVKNLYQEGMLRLLVDKNLDLKLSMEEEVKEMVEIALLCTRFNPCQRPKMSQILKMLEEDDFPDKWEPTPNAATLNSSSISCEKSERNVNYLDVSSFSVDEAIELSGPR